MPGKDYYNILGLSENAAIDQIKKAYRNLAKKYHPDANPNNKQAEDRFKEISEAYSVLGDSKKRAQYDHMRKLGAFDQRGFTGSGKVNYDDLSSIFGGFQGRRGSGKGSSFEEFSFDDLFSQFFNSFAGETNSRKSPAKGKDIHAEINVSFNVALYGGKEIVAVTRHEKCSRCDGLGAEKGEIQVCRKCSGTGAVSVGLGAFAVKRTCPECLGRGKKIGHACSACNGTGTVEKKQKLAVTIPAGAKEGQRIRLKGQGEPAIGSNRAGDLILTIRKAKHPMFEHKGADIYSQANINIVQAILGSKVRVETVEGSQVELKIPAGTNDGKVLKLKSLGANVNNVRGDHYVKIKIDMPTNLKESSKTLLIKFADDAGMKY